MRRRGHPGPSGATLLLLEPAGRRARLRTPPAQGLTVTRSFPTRRLTAPAFLLMLALPAFGQEAPESSGAHRVQAPVSQSQTAPEQPAHLPSGEVTLASMTAPSGAMLSVDPGPDALREPTDRIRIAPPGAGPEDASGGEASVLAMGPVEIRAPIVPGQWMLRYVQQSEAGPVVLAETSLTVVPEDYKSPRNRADARP